MTIDKAEELLLDVIGQDCYDDKTQEFDSRALTDYCNALMFLAEKGWVEITSHYGRRVIAKPTKKLKELWGIADV